MPNALCILYYKYNYAKYYIINATRAPLPMDHVVGATLVLEHICQIVELGFHGREANGLSCMLK